MLEVTRDLEGKVDDEKIREIFLLAGCKRKAERYDKKNREEPKVEEMLREGVRREDD
jgi:hypothetical protein